MAFIREGGENMSVSKYNNIEKNFDELGKELEELKTFSLKEIKRLKDENQVQEIQKYKTIISDTLNIRIWTDSHYGIKKDYFYITAKWSYNDEDDKYRDYFRGGFFRSK